ncbi:MAG: hypothetical protein IJ849_10600 [Selenomonadaceae bacterium]|nr:hypothetical protein [Selenomonadaceae bacterium]
MTYNNLAMNTTDEALITHYAGRENISVPDFMLRAAKEKIVRSASHPKARDEMTDEEFHALLEQGYRESLTQEGKPAKSVFARLYKELALETV